MPHPWVYSVTKTNGKITLQVEVTDFKSTAGDIEISGQATQVNGAFAPISCVTNMTESFPGKGDDAGMDFVNVEVMPVGDHEFSDKLDVTVFVHVSKAWVSVVGPGVKLNEGEKPGSEPLPTWGKHKADAHRSAQ